MTDLQIDVEREIAKRDHTCDALMTQMSAEITRLRAVLSRVRGVLRDALDDGYPDEIAASIVYIDKALEEDQ